MARINKYTFAHTVNFSKEQELDLLKLARKKNVSVHFLLKEAAIKHLKLPGEPHRRLLTTEKWIQVLEDELNGN